MTTLGSSIRDLPRSLQALILPWASIFQSSYRVLLISYLTYILNSDRKGYNLTSLLFVLLTLGRDIRPNGSGKLASSQAHDIDRLRDLSFSETYLSFLFSSSGGRSGITAFPNQNQDHIRSMGVRLLGSSTVLHTQVEKFRQMIPVIWLCYTSVLLYLFTARPTQSRFVAFAKCC